MTTISTKTGMIGYPDFNGYGANIVCLFRTDISIGTTITLESSLTSVNGSYFVKKVSHIIESETPGGRWETHIITMKINGSSESADV